MFIAKILVFIVLSLIYIYSGLKLVEPIKNETIYIFFWVAYIFFGITLLNVIAISKYWGTLSTKIGPPGARGPRGEDGTQGPKGLCTSDTNIVYAQKLIKETIADTIKQHYNDLAIDDVFNEETLQLTNNYLDYRIKLMVNSKQFETVLLTPIDDNNPNRTKNTVQIYGKTIEDLSNYLSSTWREWITGIINTDPNNARTLFITYDAQIDISPKIEQYFNTEIMKYDIWYWGATRVFRPLEAEICRSNYEIDGVSYNNTRYPIRNRPKLEIKILEFTNETIETSGNFIKLLDLSMDTATNNITKLLPRGFHDIKSRYDNPVFYLPKVYTVPTSGQKFYPIGCVIVDGNKSSSSEKRKTILVSGDIVLPDSYKPIWNNEMKIDDTYKVAYRYRRKRGLRKTETKNKSETQRDVYNTYLDPSIIKISGNYNLDNGLVHNQKIENDKSQYIEFYTFETSVPEYTFMSDLPTPKGKNGLQDLLNLINYNNINNGNNGNKKISNNKNNGNNRNNNNDKDSYKGIVAIPLSCVEEVKEYDLEWSFEHKDLFNKNLNQTINKYVAKPAGASRFNKSYYVKNKSLVRKVVEHSPISIYKNNKFNFVKAITNNQKDKPRGIKEKCYNVSSPIKEFDKKYEDLGFGWFGYPMKKYRKYSIFAYLGLMPEGIIVHRASGRKFYIKHYGGVEPNKFVINMWNEKKKDYKNVITCQNNTSCFIGVAKNSDPRCQFKVVVDKEDDKYFRLVPVQYPNKYLKMSFKVNKNANLERNANDTEDNSLEGKRPKGINLDHTEIYLSLSQLSGELEPRNPVIFFNQPATGTNMDIVEENMPRNIDRSLSSQNQYEQLKKLNRTNSNSFNYLYKEDNNVELTEEVFPQSILDYEGN